MKKVAYYTLEPVYEAAPDEFRICNASVGICCTCGGIATGMGGSRADVCLRCADVLMRGKARGAIVWELPPPPEQHEQHIDDAG